MISHAYKAALLSVLFLFVLQSCAEMKSWVAPAPKKHVRTTAHVKRPSPVPNQAPVQNKAPAPAQSDDAAGKYMEAGEYQKAINIYSEACRKQPQDQSMLKEFAKGLNGMRSTADKALGRGDTAAAGRIYTTLQTNFGRFNRVTGMLSFDKAYLNGRLAYCKKTLSRQGFEEYRKGNLDKAIFLWQVLLTIDPDNNDIKRAVRTATRQQKNLQGKTNQ